MNKNSLTILKLVLPVGIAVTIAIDSSGAAEPGHQFKLPDFPPSPFEPKFAAAPWPKPDPLLESVEDDLQRSSGSTNSAELALADEVKALKSKLVDLEATVDGSAQYYVMLSTPEELEKLRQDLRHKSAQLRTAQVR